MTIDDLIRLVPPPSKPLHAEPPVKWEIGKRGSGPDLPANWIQYAATYGSGSFMPRSMHANTPSPGDDVFGVFSVYNPFSPVFRARVDCGCNTFREAKLLKGKEVVPYPIFPDEGGLLPLGEDNSGTRLFWLTNDEPDKWPIILWWGWFPEDHHEVRMTLTDFLVKLLSCEMLFPPMSGLWSADQICFEPHEL